MSSSPETFGHEGEAQLLRDTKKHTQCVTVHLISIMNTGTGKQNQTDGVDGLAGLTSPCLHNLYNLVEGARSLTHTPLTHTHLTSTHERNRQTQRERDRDREGEE